MDPKWNLSEEEWKARLSPEAYHVLREKGTEKAFSGDYYDLKDSGTYLCHGCKNPLFDSTDKFDSKTGWPSFTKPIREDAVSYEEDHKLFRKRTEVLCSSCRSHLGHVFDDGPEPSKKRYCINSISLQFERKR